jgi:hypothetical protein
MIRSIRIGLLSLLLGLTLAFGFNAAVSDPSAQTALERGLLILLPTLAAGCLLYFLFDSSKALSRSIRPMKITIGLGAVRSFLEEHALGLFLALMFFGVYTYIGLKINLPRLDTVDNFLDADNTSWMARIAAAGGGGLEMRGPHPFAYLIFRPLGWIMNQVTGDFALSAILLNTFAGGLAVLFAWIYLWDWTGNRVYASLIAGLLGLSTSHLFLGSVVESYIFSAALLIFFFLMLRVRSSSLAILVVGALLTFGITLTNFIQNLIGFIISRPRIGEVLRFAALTLSAGVILSMVHAAWYPSSELFFLPSEAQGERQFTLSIFDDPPWRAGGRVQLLVRTMFLYSVVAPRPYVFIEEVGGSFPRFNFFKIVPGTFSFSSYDGLGNVIILAWAALLAAGGLASLVAFFRTRKADVRLAFALCLVFNFMLHLNYGYEPFLYSPNWTYALVFFVALSLAPFAARRIFQAGMGAFLVLLAYHQFQFFSFIFETIAPYLHQVSMR